MQGRLLPRKVGEIARRESKKWKLNEWRPNLRAKCTIVSIEAIPSSFLQRFQSERCSDGVGTMAVYTHSSPLRDNTEQIISQMW